MKGKNVMLFLVSICISLGIGYSGGVIDRKPEFFKFTLDQGIQRGCLKALIVLIDREVIDIVNRERWVSTIFYCNNLTKRDL
jgi:hypothetical protein